MNKISLHWDDEKELVIEEKDFLRFSNVSTCSPFARTWQHQPSKWEEYSEVLVPKDVWNEENKTLTEWVEYGRTVIDIPGLIVPSLPLTLAILDRMNQVIKSSPESSMAKHCRNITTDYLESQITYSKLSCESGHGVLSHLDSYMYIFDSAKLQERDTLSEIMFGETNRKVLKGLTGINELTSTIFSEKDSISLLHSLINVLKQNRTYECLFSTDGIKLSRPKTKYHLSRYFIVEKN